MTGEKKVIWSQMQKLWRFERISKSVSGVNTNIYMDERTIGVKSEKIRFNSYVDSINSIIHNEGYSVEFIDGAMVNFWYEFDEKDNCCMHSISYIPYYKDVLDEESEDANLDEDYFREHVSKYLRIDYEEQGRTEFCHSLIHMHLGPGRESLRMPVDSVIYPEDFMFFVLKYIYEEKIDSSIFDRRKSNEIGRYYLTDAEKQGPHISFLDGDTDS